MYRARKSLIQSDLFFVNTIFYNLCWWISEFEFTYFWIFCFYNLSFIFVV